MIPGIEIIIGTYENFLLGYKFETKNEKEVLTQSFADKSHSGAIRCLAVQGQWIASGATDDRIFIYDMRSRKQSQILLSHDGSINALAFTPNETHLLSGGQDGRMIVTRISTWFKEATWTKAHNGSPVTHICCHPSGKMALSLGTDLILRTWNLVKGRVAYKTNLKTRNTLGTLPDCLASSPNGEYFTLTGSRLVEIWSIKAADVVRSQKTSAKPVSLGWIGDETCLVGLEDGKILWIDLKESEDKAVTIEAHTARVKAIANYGELLVTASSAGDINVWKIDLINKKLKEISSTNIGCRPTCIGILDIEQFGSNYTSSSKVTKTQEKPLQIEKKPQKLERGVVTIEYENDDSDNIEDDVNETTNNESEKNENESSTDLEEEGDNDNGESDQDKSGDDSTISSDESVEDEPQIRLPKSRKRKQQLLNSQKEAKQVKPNQKTHKKNIKTPSQLKQNKNHQNLSKPKKKQKKLNLNK